VAPVLIEFVDAEKWEQGKSQEAEPVPVRTQAESLATIDDLKKESFLCST